MVLSEQHDEWQVAWRYMSVDSITTAMRPALTVEVGGLEEVTPALIAG